MQVATHGFLPQSGLGIFGKLEVHYLFDAPTTLSDADYMNTVEVNAGVTTFKSLFDFSGNAARIGVPALVNAPVMDVANGTAVFDGNRWFNRFIKSSVTVRTIAIKLKGMPATPSTVGTTVGQFAEGTSALPDGLILGSASGSIANEAITYQIPGGNTAATLLTSTTIPPAPWFTLIIRPFSRKIDLNGAPLTLSQPGATPASANMDLSIGLRISNGNKFTGEIQEVALWSTEVTDVDIADIHELIK